LKRKSQSPYAKHGERNFWMLVLKHWDKTKLQVLDER